MSALPATTTAPRPRLRVLPPPPRPRLRTVLAALIVGTGVVFAAVALNAMAAGDAVRARALEERVAGAEQRYRELIARVAELEDPARIERVATEELGMVPATAPRILHVTRPLPADGYVPDPAPRGQAADPLKPILSAER